MAKIVLDMSMSLDGFIAGPDDGMRASDGCRRAHLERRNFGSRPVSGGPRRHALALPRCTRASSIAKGRCNDRTGHRGTAPAGRSADFGEDHD